MTNKTIVMKKLDALKVPYTPHEYQNAISGVDVAHALGQDVCQVFKTLVTVGKSGEHYVFLVPVAEELDLKKCAKEVGEKSVEMLRSKDLLPLTGYIHGGCSPIAMKKQFATIIDSSAYALPTIIFSGGKIGTQVELSCKDLSRVIPFTFADITKD